MSLREDQEKSLKSLENILTKETVASNIFKMSFFIMFFELLKHFVEERLKELYCEENPNAIDYKDKYLENDNYKKNVKCLDKNLFLANIKWFQNHNALSLEEYHTIDKARRRRNFFVHEFFKSLAEGFLQDDASLLLELSSIFYKLDSWWVYNFEFPDDEIPEPEKVRLEDCHGSEAFAIQIMIDAITRNDNKYGSLLDEIRSKLNEVQHDERTQIRRRQDQRNSNPQARRL